jgi:hypothetical protein
MNKDQYNTLIAEIRACREDIAALRKLVINTHDPILQALLEEYIKVKPSPQTLANLVNQANKKSS